MNRRELLKASSAALILPGIVKAESIMRVQPTIIFPDEWGWVYTSSEWLTICFYNGSGKVEVIHEVRWPE